MTSPHSEMIRTAFDSAAASYDALRRRLIPEFDGFYGVALALLEEAVGDRAFACIDLGVGTGALLRDDSAPLSARDNRRRRLRGQDDRGGAGAARAFRRAHELSPRRLRLRAPRRAGRGDSFGALHPSSGA